MPSKEQAAPDRPWWFLVWTTFFVVTATAGTVWAIRSAPDAMLVGQPGRHDIAGAAAACLDCHVPFVGSPASRCLSPGCHGDLATGTPPRDGPAMPVRFHVALRDLPCGRCHEEHRTLPTARLFDHRLIPDVERQACRRCHHAESQANHARMDAVACGTCHGESTWKGSEMNHARVSDQPCELCHARPTTRRHAAVAGTCDDCHTTTDWTQRRTANQDAAK